MTKHKTYYSEEKETYIHEGLNHLDQICIYNHYSTEEKLIEGMDKHCYYKDSDSFEGIYEGKYVEDE